MTHPDLFSEQANPAESVKYTALSIDIEELQRNGVISFCRPIARFKARGIRKRGVLCKSINQYTVKILREP